MTNTEKLKEELKTKTSLKMIENAIANIQEPEEYTQELQLTDLKYYNLLNDELTTRG